jgi:GH24 family phage-related lysozyme (muramidase)
VGAVEILPNSALHWPIIWPGVVEVARSECCRLRAYRDIAGVWTIGWGETENVRPGDVMTQDEADRLLCARLGEFAQNVEALLARPATPHQLAAMVSLAYNVGLAGFARSSVLRAHNAGNALAAARAFGLWNKARVRGVLEEVRGLTARRAREAARITRRWMRCPMRQRARWRTCRRPSPSHAWRRARSRSRGRCRWRRERLRWPRRHPPMCARWLRAWASIRCWWWRPWR